MSLFNLLFSSLSKLWYVEVRISRSVSVSPLEFEITGVDCIYITYLCSLETVLIFHANCHLFMFPRNSIDISCKLSPLETICMKCPILFPGKKEKNKYFKCRLLKILRRELNVKWNWFNNFWDFCPIWSKLYSFRVDPQRAHGVANVTSMSIQRHDVPSTLIRRWKNVMCPLGRLQMSSKFETAMYPLLLSQCKLITPWKLKGKQLLLRNQRYILFMKSCGSLIM